MPEHAIRHAGLLGVLALALAAFVYFFALNSEHAATNGDELLYAQITRVTAQTGHWLPLQSKVERHRNTKPPALFWQGIASTDWAARWDLWHLRYPNVLYTLAIAAMAFFVARKAGSGNAAGVLAVLIYLAFFGTYRYGRVFLTSAPETFWLFAPFFVLLVWRPRAGGLTWPLAFAFGLMFGIASLYKSFALALPAAAGLAWWTLHLRGYRVGPWLRGDAPKIALASVLALGVFSLWYWLDPQRHLILADFVLKENLGKFDTEGENYFVNLLWGESSVWRNVVAYPINAGLLAPALVAVFVLAFLRRSRWSEDEKLLWIWVATVFVAFTLPNQRDERYLLPAMPALAVLCALYWESVPRWILGISLAAVGVIAFGMGWGAVILTSDLGEGPLYPWFFWVFIGGVVLFAFFGIARAGLTRAFAAPGILLLYLAYGLFLIPFDGPLGEFDEAARAFARGRAVAVPINFGAREEVYLFMLPGCDARPYRQKPDVTVEKLRQQDPLFIISVPLADTAAESAPDSKVMGRRLNIIDRFNNEETMDMLRGNVSRNLFKKDIFLQTPAPKQP